MAQTPPLYVAFVSMEGCHYCHLLRERFGDRPGVGEIPVADLLEGKYGALADLDVPYFPYLLVLPRAGAPPDPRLEPTPVSGLATLREDASWDEYLRTFSPDALDPF